VSRHGLRLLARVKSWSVTKVLTEEVVPGGGGSVPPTGTSSVGSSSKTRGSVVDHPASIGTRWSTEWSTVPLFS
jgi:hypothetical protein